MGSDITDTIFLRAKMDGCLGCPTGYTHPILKTIKIVESDFVLHWSIEPSLNYGIPDGG